MRNFTLCLLFISLIGACAEPRRVKYEELLNPQLGKGKKKEMDKLFGSPTKCVNEENSEIQKCEYRVARAHNDAVPDVYRKAPTFGPDLSPYDNFDVIQLSFDSFGVLKDWQAPLIP